NKKYTSADPAGGILISGETYSALQGKIPARYAGDESLKGKQKSVPIYQVLTEAITNDEVRMTNDR
ncbi:MAG TPA: hypothetical protein VGQ81_06655, partial [Acidobacteriota bacterium]|nr:hypothetical protein [Acidobacteriota bacterium]